MTSVRILPAFLLIGLAGSAQAQTVLAPSGDSAVTQPGGTQGRGARHNLRQAVRDGDVVGVPPGARGVDLGTRPLRRGPSRPYTGQ